MKEMAEKRFTFIVSIDKARPGQASYSYFDIVHVIPVLQHDKDWVAESGKATAKKIIDKSIALTTRIHINIEISTIIALVDKNVHLSLYELSILDMDMVVLLNLSLYFSRKISY